MKVLLCAVGHFRKDENGGYYAQPVEHARYCVYKSIAEDLTIMASVRGRFEGEPFTKADFYAVAEIPDLMRLKNWRFIKKAFKIIAEKVAESDYVVISGSSPANLFAFNAARKQSKPVLVNVIGCSWDSFWNYGTLPGKVSATFMFFIQRYIVKNAPYVLYVTEKFLQKRYPTNGKTSFASSVAIGKADDAILKQRINKIESLKNKKLIIGTLAGVDVRYKGQEYVIRALHDLKKRDVNFVYQLAGGGDRTYLQSIAESLDVADRVEFMGRLSRNEVFEWLDSIDIYAHPSLMEGLPRSLIEAMSRGIPCLGARTAGIPELLDKSVICRRKNINDICNVLEKFANDKKFTIEQSEQNFREAQNYDRDILETRRNAFFEMFKNQISIR